MVKKKISVHPSQLLAHCACFLYLISWTGPRNIKDRAKQRMEHWTPPPQWVSTNAVFNPAVLTLFRYTFTSSAAETAKSMKINP